MRAAWSAWPARSRGLGELAHFPSPRPLASITSSHSMGTGPADHHAALQAVLDWLRHSHPDREVATVNHRVVHGGADVSSPSCSTTRAASACAPDSLAPCTSRTTWRASMRRAMAFPAAQQVACFDTAFPTAAIPSWPTASLPRQYYEQGIRRYGFTACPTSSSRASSGAAIRACCRAA